MIYIILLYFIIYCNKINLYYYHSNITSSYNAKIGKWILAQRAKYKNGKLNDIQIKMLNELNFIYI